MRVDGRLDASAAAELNLFAAACGPPGQLTIRLAGLTSIDEAGRRALLRLREAGCRLIDGSLYVSRLLEETTR